MNEQRNWIKEIDDAVIGMIKPIQKLSEIKVRKTEITKKDSDDAVTIITNLTEQGVDKGYNIGMIHILYVLKNNFLPAVWDISGDMHLLYLQICTLIGMLEKEGVWGND